jgi:hypothetical protein
VMWTQPDVMDKVVVRMGAVRQLIDDSNLTFPISDGMEDRRSGTNCGESPIVESSAILHHDLVGWAIGRTLAPSSSANVQPLNND